MGFGNSTPLSPTPATCHKRKQNLHCNDQNAALQKLHCNIGFPAVRMSLFAKSCAATTEKLHSNIGKAALQESGAFVPLSCGFQAPTFGLPCLGLAETGKTPHRRCVPPCAAKTCDVRPVFTLVTRPHLGPLFVLKFVRSRALGRDFFNRFKHKSGR